MIEIRELLMRYNKREVLNIRALDFEKGKSYGLVGHNGAGKTTLFKCITNINCTFSGKILIDGVCAKEDTSALRHVSIVLDGMSVYRGRTGWFNIQYFSGLRGQENEARAKELAHELDIAHALDQKVNTYSYGMQKKLILLIALLFEPKVLILDEPFRGLDFDSVKWFKGYLKELTAGGLTLLISSHVQSDLEALCEEVFIIDKGVISDHIDMLSEKKKMIRLLDTSNNAQLIQLLGEMNYPFELDDENRVKLDIGVPEWSTIESQLKKANIEITEMSKAKVLDKILN